MKEELLKLEEMVDKHGLRAVLDALAEICHAKAEHVESAWQDAVLARQWTRTAQTVEKVAAMIDPGL